MLLLLRVLLVTQATADTALYALADTEKLQLSVIDLSKGVGLNAAQVLEAGRTRGAFMVVNHGVNDTVIANGLSVLQQFFALPEQEKLRLAHPEGTDVLTSLLTGYSRIGNERVDSLNDEADAKPDPVEKFSLTFSPGFELGAQAQTRFHTLVPNMQEHMESLLRATMSLGRRVFQEIAVATGMTANYFDQYLSDGATCAMRCLHYPGGNMSSPQLRLAPHTDKGPFTLLLSDKSESLEYLVDGKWMPVAHHEGAFLVHLGDAVSHLTNMDQEWKSNWHRVGRPFDPHKAESPTSASYASRVSVAHFMNFDPDMLFQPLHSDTPQTAVRYTEWLAQQFAKKGYISEQVGNSSGLDTKDEL